MRARSRALGLSALRGNQNGRLLCQPMFRGNQSIPEVHRGVRAQKRGVDLFPGDTG